MTDITKNDAHANKKLNILVIDDTPMQIKILSQILSPLYSLKVATTGEKGIEIAEKHPIDLIMLDIIMEDMSGFEVLERLKASSTASAIPVIFITSMDTVESEVKGLTLGAVDYIVKPFIDEIVLLRVGLHAKLIKQVRFIEESTLYDTLTGIYNRQCFNKALSREWDYAIENGQCISLIMIDIDNFKSFNDMYGHFFGDDCLISVANALTIRDFDTVFRWGGEEFVVLLPDVPLSIAESIAERIRKVVEEKPMECAKGRFATITISLGVGTIFPNLGDRPEDFCSEVDKMLYRAKENGKNRVEATMV